MASMTTTRSRPRSTRFRAATLKVNGAMGSEGTTLKYHEIDVTAYLRAQAEGAASFVPYESAGKYTTLNAGSAAATGRS